MAAEYGREVVFTWNGTVVPGVREKSLTIDGEPVNVTSDEDGGRRVLLDADAETSIDIELSGVTKSNVFRKAKANGDVTGEAVLTYKNGDVLTLPTAQLGAYTDGIPYQEAVTFTQAIMSSGEFTYVEPE